MILRLLLSVWSYSVIVLAVKTHFGFTHAQQRPESIEDSKLTGITWAGSDHGANSNHG